MVQQKKLVKREYELDALRGIAAMLVVLYHYSGITDFKLPFLIYGVTGVDLFFIISGYVIFMTLEKTRMSKDFIISRLSRIYPSYLVMIAITLVVIYFFGAAPFPSLKAIMGNLTMMQPILLVPNIDEVYWTLTVEIQFYIFMLLVFNLRQLDNIEILGASVIILIQVFYLLAGHFMPESKVFIWPRSFVPLINHFHLFFAGMVFYRMKKLGPTLHRHMLIILCFISALFIFYGSGKAHFFMNVYEYAVVLLVYLIIFYLFVFQKLEFITAKPLIFLGSISYCLYLIHLRSGHTLYFYIYEHYAPNRTLLTLSIIGLMIIISSAVTFRIERPVIRYIRERYKRKESRNVLVTNV